MKNIDARTILNFITQYFDFILELYRLNKDGLIFTDNLAKLCNRNNIEIKKLLDYKIIDDIGNESYELNVNFNDFLSFLIDDFKLDLPESIKKYKNSINEIFAKLKLETDKNKIIALIDGLIKEIRKFLSDIQLNTVELIRQVNELKSNINKIEYIDKMRKAAFLIDYFISPLNQILSEHHESVFNQILEISTFANERKLNYPDKNIRDNFEKLYIQTSYTSDELTKHSKILTKNLLPLLERMKTESAILSGFIEYLKTPYLYETPKLMKSTKNNTYTTESNIRADCNEIFEQFANPELVIVEDNIENQSIWLFDSQKYKDLIKESLPIEDYFEWCKKILLQEFFSLEIDKFFALASLPFQKEFGNEIELSFSEEGNKNEIDFNFISTDSQNNNVKLNVPKISLANVEI